jgi:hypothetical protein
MMGTGACGSQEITSRLGQPAYVHTLPAQIGSAPMNRLLSADAAGDFEAAHVIAHLIALHSGRFKQLCRVLGFQALCGSRFAHKSSIQCLYQLLTKYLA